MTPPPVHRYVIGGLRIESPIELPEARLVESGVADIRIELGQVTIPAGREDRYFRVGEAGDIFFDVPSVARYRISNGNRIVVDPAADAEPDAIRLYLLGSAFGAVCLQRGLLPLHASGVVVEGECLAFVGPSGVGKSTIAAALMASGHTVICDDVLVVEIGDRGARGWPGLARIRLHDDSVSALLRGTLTGSSTVRVDKRELAVRDTPKPVAYPLRAIVELSQNESVGGALSVARVHGLHALDTVRLNTYRLELLDATGRAAEHFEICASLAASVPIYRLTWRRSYSDLIPMFEAVEAAILESVAVGTRRTALFHPDDKSTHQNSPG